LDETVMSHLVSRKGRSLVAGLALACGAVHSAPVNFDLSTQGFVAGAGYGVDNNEITGTLLDVLFEAAAGSTQSTLLNVGDSFSFNVGVITLREGFITDAETDDLGVLAVLNFVDPFAGLRAVVAEGTADVGFVGDLAVDYTINWNPRQFAFGDGGLFGLTMDSLSFRLDGGQRTQTATITLLAMPVPEPGALSLAGIALLAAGAASRRRRAA
jgi:PEP-CTERM motif